MQQARWPLPPHVTAVEVTGMLRTSAKRNEANNIGPRPLFGDEAAKRLVAAAGSRNSGRFTGMAVGAGRGIPAGRSLRFWEGDKDRPADFAAAVAFRELPSSTGFFSQFRG